MIYGKEYLEISDYLQKNYPIRDEELDRYDDLILSCANPQKAKSKPIMLALEHAAAELQSRLVCEVTIHNAITPMAAAYAERLQQVRVTIARAKDIDPLDDLSLLCVAMGYDLKWAYEQSIEETTITKPVIVLDDFYTDDLPF